MSKTSLFDSNFNKKCKNATHKLNQINRDVGLSKARNILNSSLLGPDKYGMYHYSDPWCTDVYCEYKDKCERSMENFVSCGLQVDKDISECSKKYFDSVSNKIALSKDPRKLKTISGEAQKCSSFRSLYDEFCKSSTFYPYTRPTTEIDGVSWYGEPSHAFQSYSFDKVAKEAHSKIISLGYNPLDIKRKTPKRRTTRKSGANRKKASSVYATVAQKTRTRKNKRKN